MNNIEDIRKQYKAIDENYSVEDGNLHGDDYVLSHPAFGVLMFNRRHGNSYGYLYGSDISHRDTIALTISTSKMMRGLSNDWYFDDKRIIEVEMSYAQFTEAISTMNQAPGVPVTLRYTQKDGKIPSCRFIDKKTLFCDEFRKSINEHGLRRTEDAKKAETILQKKSIGKGDREELLKIIQSLSSSYQFDSHADFAYKQFVEAMDDAVKQAKGEVEAFAQNKLHNIATQALAEHPEQLGSLTSNKGNFFIESTDE